MGFAEFVDYVSHRCLVLSSMTALYRCVGMGGASWVFVLFAVLGAPLSSLSLFTT